MPRFDPLLPPRPLPSVGTASEGAVWDLKKQLGPATMFHLAKDVAAFANHLGGTLFVGAEELHGAVGAYYPLSGPDVADAEKRYSEAVRERCVPTPTLDFCRYTVPNGTVLAVNVWPIMFPLVAVRVDALKSTEGYAGPAFVFPIRVGTHTQFIQPERIALYLEPHVRRSAILLHSIPPDSLLDVRVEDRHGGNPQADKHRFVAVEEEKNLVTFMPTNGPTRISMPLNMVKTVYEDAWGWHVLFDSYI